MLQKYKKLFTLPPFVDFFSYICNVIAFSNEIYSINSLIIIIL